MLKLEQIQPGIEVSGLVANGSVKILVAEMISAGCCQCTFRGADGNPRETALYRSDEERLSLVEIKTQWTFDADGESFKLATEAHRINLAHLFDPFMAVHTANVEPLPHQITAVYETMLPRQPLRFVLADDPGAGKTVMAGLLIRELLLRAAAKRILIVAPGSLVEQWRVELEDKFGLRFGIYSAYSGAISPGDNPFEEVDQMIVRLDQLSRNDDAREKALRARWDLVIFDEAHKLSASWNGGDIRRTRRYELAEELGARSVHLLLMTATPHNGKEEDFQLFMRLLDTDRFYGRYRDGAHKVDISDLMRRMVKEDLYKFDGRPLFPERRAYTAKYELSPKESALYDAVTSYVRNGMNLLDALKDGKRKGTVGFALASLQRRLASSPAAIFKSLKRRHEKLLKLREEERQRGQSTLHAEELLKNVSLSDENYLDWEDEVTNEEFEQESELLISGATLAETLEELDKEVAELEWLVELASDVVSSNEDRKWEELSRLLQETPEMMLPDGGRRKLLIFTEHKDTLEYLRVKIGNDLLGLPDAVATIDGSTVRERRLVIQEQFNNDPSTLVLIATDAAGEGVNFQQATNLMINYDLPWNPNRLEQRFGRIHRIGQQEMCHMWNLLAANTREGDVFDRLFVKLDKEREALKGKVFDILGAVFENVSLKDLLIEAIQNGQKPEVKARLDTAIEDAFAREHLNEILRRNALNQEVLDQTRVLEVRQQMEAAEARKLQPYFISSFFTEAFRRLGGEFRPRETGRLQITNVPHPIRERDRQISGRTGEAAGVQRVYERICFQREHLRTGAGSKQATLMHPGHPLMQAILDMIREEHRDTLKMGAMLLDPLDMGVEPRLLYIVEHCVVDDTQRVNMPTDVSRELHFVMRQQDGTWLSAGPGPHLDLRPLSDDIRALVAPELPAAWLKDGLEREALGYASEHLAQPHFERVSERRKSWVDRTRAAVQERLATEKRYWNHRAESLKEDLKAGKGIALNVQNAIARVNEITARMNRRLAELDEMRVLRSTPPKIVGAAIVVPEGLVKTLRGEQPDDSDLASERKRIELIAMKAVIDKELARGHAVEDVSALNLGWDVTSREPNGREWHIEVKGRHAQADSVTITRNEMLAALNQGDKFRLAIVLVDGESHKELYYVDRPFAVAPDWGESDRTYKINALLATPKPVLH